MSLRRQIARGLRALLRPAAADRDVADEVRDYLDRRTAELVAQGQSLDEARRTARLESGTPVTIREEIRSSGWEHRLTTLAGDARYALRVLRRRPAFTALTVTTLALGIGATTAIWSVVNPVLFEPLPFAGSDRVMTVWQPNSRSPLGRMGFVTAQDIAHDVRAFEWVAASDLATASLTGGATPEFVVGERVTWPFFKALGVAPALGRDFRPDEDVPNAPRVVVLADGLWRRRFGGDRAVLGRSITLDGRPYTVVGVMPRGFQSFLEPDAQMWIPLRYDALAGGACRFCRHLQVLARLRPQVTPAQAHQELAAVYQRLKREYPDTYLETEFPLVSLRDYVSRDVRAVLLTVLGAVGFVLLIACVNVTNLLLGQGVQRRGEFAVRTALGAGRARLVRQLLTESMLLAVLGGAVGIALAFAAVPALVALAPPGLPLARSIRVDLSVLGFAFVITSAVGMLFGLVPAWHVARRSLSHEMTGASRRTVRSGRATRVSLVVSEVALALVLLVGSGLLLQSLRRLFAVRPGFEAANVITLQVQTGGPKYATAAATASLYEQVVTAVRALPGVQSAAFTSQLPLSSDFDQYGVHGELDPATNTRQELPGYRYAVSDRYFETMGVPILRGRSFTAADRADQRPVAVIGATAARETWGGRDPIGRRVRIGSVDAGPWYEIVGVAGDVKQRSLLEGAENAIYVPESQWPSGDGAISLVVRTSVDPGAMLASVRRAVWSIDADVPLVRETTLPRLVALTAARPRFALILFEAFALLALVLAGAGIYGVLAGSVSERTREIGVRAALGASRQTVVRLVLRQGLTITAAGIAIGLVAAALLSRLVERLLFQTPSIEPVTYLAVSGLLLLVALLACWAPAARAARIDPMEALRAE